MRRTIVLIMVLLAIAMLAGCSTLSQRQQFATSALAFSGAVKAVDGLKKAGKLTDGELVLLVKSLKVAEKGLDEWKAALEEYEKKVDIVMKATIKKAVTDVLLEAAKARIEK